MTWRLALVLFLWSSLAWAAPTMIVTPAAVAINGTMTVTVQGGPGAATDWVGIYVPGTPDGSYLAWKWLNNTSSQPEAGLTGGTLLFPMPTAGTYEVRFYDLNYTRLATSPPITVSATPVPPVPVLPPVPVVVPPTLTLTPSQSMTVKVTGGPGTPLDWIGLFKVGAANDKWLDWFRLNGTKVATNGFVTGGATFKVPSTGGPFEIRFFQNTGYANKLATSAPIGSPVVTTPPATGTVTVNVVAPGTFKGWSGDPRCTAVPMILTTDVICTATFGPP
jgi:hypothetical protein